MASAVNSHPLIESLGERGWAVVDDFIDLPTHAALVEDFRLRQARDEFRPAAVGRGATTQLAPEIRSDLICWWEPSALSTAQSTLSEKFEDLRATLNRTLFAGLVDWEGHYAMYPPGAAYQTHVDRFRSDDRRMISSVLYLTPEWTTANGGELVLFPGNASQEHVVQPLPRRLVLFQSADVPHQVRTSHAERLSLASWFRRNKRSS